MKLLYLDCGMGASGDMLLGALLPLQPDPTAALEQLNHLSPRVRVEAEETLSHGLTGLRVQVLIDGAEEDEPHHGHEHGHEHHHGASLSTIREHIDALPVSDRVKADAKSVYGLLAEAEAAAHGNTVDAVHFHEIGMLDAIIDITGVCLLIDALRPVRIVASPVHVGSGTVHCAHGELPVPAPATLRLIEGMPVYGGEIAGELCTPTGAALLRCFVDSFGPMPLMRVQKSGSGLGKKEFSRMNALRASLGVEECTQDGPNDENTELSCNLDDMTGEDMAFALEELMRLGARDVCYLPVVMKKGRPGYRLLCQCIPEDADRLAAEILRLTTSFGVQRTDTRRYVLERDAKETVTPIGTVRIKTGAGYGAQKRKVEYADAAACARKSGATPGEMAREALCCDKKERI